jgi:hypothetical protein
MLMRRASELARCLPGPALEGLVESGLGLIPDRGRDGGDAELPAFNSFAARSMRTRVRYCKVAGKIPV